MTATMEDVLHDCCMAVTRRKIHFPLYVISHKSTVQILACLYPGTDEIVGRNVSLLTKFKKERSLVKLVMCHQEKKAILENEVLQRIS